MTFNTLAKNTNTRQAAKTTVQLKPAANAPVAQVKNNAGGYVFEISPLQKLDRFLLIGTSGGTFYQNEANLTNQNVDAVIALIKANGKVVVDRVVEISQAGRAKNNDYALLVLALVFTHGDIATKLYAKDKVKFVARTGTHFLHFVAFANGLRGWGRSLKSVVQKWYSEKTTDQLAYQVVKYKQRDGWAHKDVIKLAHVKPGTDTVRNNLYKFIAKGPEGLAPGDVVPQLLVAAEQAKTADAKTLIKLIQDFNLTHEMIPNEMKSIPAVWEALIPHMGLNALTRNLNKLTAVGLIKPLSSTSKVVIEKLQDIESIKRERLHPISIIVAKKIYEQGHGDKGSLVWTPDRNIGSALEDAFYLSFDAVEPSNKNIYLGLDVSGSMGMAYCSGSNLLTCREASGILAMVTARTEPWVAMYGFTGAMQDLPITRQDRLDAVIKKISGLRFGATDCSAPMTHAIQQGFDVDAFVIYTDSDTWCGKIHPFQALRQYREKMNKPQAKLIVCAMTASPFTIADPTDAGMLDVVGFDTQTPKFISEFAAGRL
jgi:60 kDa SS-A/Ro ribonucleoprotein